MGETNVAHELEVVKNTEAWALKEFDRYKQSTSQSKSPNLNYYPGSKLDFSVDNHTGEEEAYFNFHFAFDDHIHIHFSRLLYYPNNPGQHKSDALLLCDLYPLVQRSAEKIHLTSRPDFDGMQGVRPEIRMGTLGKGFPENNLEDALRLISAVNTLIDLRLRD